MTTETDFIEQLNKTPSDHSLKLVFADFLQELNDPRAEGYRALGHVERIPAHYIGSNEWTWWRQLPPPALTPSMYLPEIWWDKLIPTKQSYFRESNYHTYTEALDAAAIAYSKLSIQTRNKIVTDWLTYRTFYTYQ